jgi:hypothetical protein
MLVLAGCLDAPPTYEEPERIPPFIIGNQVIPALNAVVELSPDGIMNINVPFRSEDLGEQVWGVVYVDVPPGQAATMLVRTFVQPPSTYNDESRAISGQITIAGEPGCHSVTLVVSHAFNVLPERVLDETKAARVVWWVHLKDSEAERTLLEDCITQSVE